jgi:hypothetical protein
VDKIRIFLDTNVMLEAFRIRCWNAITNHYSVETVSKCAEEALTGDPDDPRHISVPPDDLYKLLCGKHSVEPKLVASLVLAHPSCSALDDGEKHLFAWLEANQVLSSDSNLLATADKAALVASHKLGWLDYVRSLEVLARDAGVPRPSLERLALQYREDWLTNTKIKIRMGIIP